MDFIKRWRSLPRHYLLVGLAAILLIVTVSILATRGTTPIHLPSKDTITIPSPSAYLRKPLALTRYVNPFIGTAPGGVDGFDFAGGNVFPGATYPMGMVQWSPDTVSRLPGGYDYPDHSIKGFSLTHFSGRGCTVYQDIPFMPYIPGTSSLRAPFSHTQERASPGYYSVRLLDSGIDVALTVTQHTGMGQFTYPASPHAALQIDAGGSINGSANAHVTINASAQEVTGQSESIVGCGRQHYIIYFAAHFDRPFVGSSGTGTPTATLLFDTTSNHVVHATVGISFVSVANAAANVASENPYYPFPLVVVAADAAWNARLNTIQVMGGTPAEMTAFYTALYHSFIHPNIFSDANGQYRGFDNQVHTVPPGHAQYGNIPGWDQYRSQTRLLAVLAPTEAADIAQSLVNDAQQGDGHLPRWEQANTDSHGMIGDSATAEIASIAAFGDTGFDTAAALNAMIDGQPKVREGLADYVQLGYVAATTVNYSAAATQEYANDDFALAQFALAQGKSSVAATYLRRSDNWRHLLNPASGTIQPRYRDGSWAGFAATSGFGFAEADAAQMTWMEPFNMHGLFVALGGNTAVVSRLDTFFTRLNDGLTSPYAYMGNEPCEEVPWSYDFAGAPSHTQAVVRRIETQLFQAQPNGLPGNDDAGSLSSWYVFAALGLYPDIPGVGGFVIGSPLFPHVTLHLANDKVLQIDAPAASDATPYVQSLLLNGVASTSLWLPWSLVKDGATLAFTLGASATSWGSGSADAPPSYAAG